MTSLEVINTDAFLDMPQSSQLLYFHLNARADDDGFVSNPKSIMRNCGSQGDDLKLLIAKKFIISFEDGVCVIKHWRINNYIRKDIYKETKYLDHKQTLFIRPNGAYTLTNDDRAVQIPSGHFNVEDIKLKNPLLKPQFHVHGASTTRALSIGKDRLGKDSIDKIRINKKPEQSSVFCLEDKLKEMEKNPNSYLDIIATFIREKKIAIDNSRQLSAVIKRYCRVAKTLEGAFTNEKIFQAIQKIKSLKIEIDWTLETVYKFLTK